MYLRIRRQYKEKSHRQEQVGEEERKRGLDREEREVRGQERVVKVY